MTPDRIVTPQQSGGVTGEENDDAADDAADDEGGGEGDTEGDAEDEAEDDDRTERKKRKTKRNAALGCWRLLQERPVCWDRCSTTTPTTVCSFDALCVGHGRI